MSYITRQIGNLEYDIAVNNPDDICDGNVAIFYGAKFLTGLREKVVFSRITENMLADLQTEAEHDLRCGDIGVSDENN